MSDSKRVDTEKVIEHVAALFGLLLIGEFVVLVGAMIVGAVLRCWGVVS